MRREFAIENTYVEGTVDGGKSSGKEENENEGRHIERDRRAALWA
jgi:hypothetical protein